MSSRRGSRRKGKSRRNLVIVAVILVAAIAAGVVINQRNAVDPVALLNRVAQRIDEGKLNDAVIDLKTVIAEQPDNRRARAMLGNLYLEGGNPKGALKELRRARELGVSDPQVSRGIARALLTTGYSGLSTPWLPSRRSSCGCGRES